MTMWEIILISILIPCAVNLIRAERKIVKQDQQLRDHARKLYSADHDIKTLHVNQKVLQSSIKELRKDLKVYGEIKRSKDKYIFPEKTDEDDWPKDTGAF